MTHHISLPAIFFAAFVGIGCAASGGGNDDSNGPFGAGGAIDTSGGSGGNAMPVDSGSGAMSTSSTTSSGSGSSSAATGGSSTSASSSSTTSGGGNGKLCNKVTILNSNKACSECLEQNCCKVIHACIDEDLLGCVACLDCFFEGKGAACCNEAVGKNAWVEECVEFNCVKECS
ncbi:MAG: hypothetical protein FJ095_19615 [Deltaproteobacteria bacterium]|nr:hypothetical protein [Deltaproteobacteria bacterium]